MQLYSGLQRTLHSLDFSSSSSSLLKTVHGFVLIASMIFLSPNNKITNTITAMTGSSILTIIIYVFKVSSEITIPDVDFRTERTSNKILNVPMIFQKTNNIIETERYFQLCEPFSDLDHKPAARYAAPHMPRR